MTERRSFGAASTSIRPAGSSAPNGGAVFVRRLIMRLCKATGEVFRAASAALAVAGSGPAGHQCHRGLDSSSGWPAGPPLRGHRRPPSAAVLPGCRPCCAQRRREEIWGWSSSSGVGLVVLGDDGCRDASSLADLDALLLRPFTHGRRVVTVMTWPAGATATCRPACVLDIPAEVPAYLRCVLLRQVDLVCGAIDGEANCRVCL